MTRARRRINYQMDTGHLRARVADGPITMLAYMPRRGRALMPMPLLRRPSSRAGAEVGSPVLPRDIFNS